MSVALASAAAATVSVRDGNPVRSAVPLGSVGASVNTSPGAPAATGEEDPFGQMLRSAFDPVANAKAAADAAPDAAMPSTAPGPDTLASGQITRPNPPASLSTSLQTIKTARASKANGRAAAQSADSSAGSKGLLQPAPSALDPATPMRDPSGLGFALPAASTAPANASAAVDVLPTTADAPVASAGAELVAGGPSRDVAAANGSCSEIAGAGAAQDSVPLNGAPSSKSAAALWSATGAAAATTPTGPGDDQALLPGSFQKPGTARSSAADLGVPATAGATAARGAVPSDRKAAATRLLPQTPVQTLVPAGEGPTPQASNHKNQNDNAQGDAAGSPQATLGDPSNEPLASPVALLPDPVTTVPASIPVAHPAAPVEQVAPALLTLMKTQDGNQQMTVRLHPDDLGMVQVKLERTLSGATHIEITAEKPDTLQTLQRDQIRLHHTLDEAGIPANGRTLTFHVAPSVHAMPAAASPGQGSGQGNGQHTPASRTNNGAANPEGSSGGRAGYLAREASRSGGRASSGPSPSTGTIPLTSMRSYRIGLDITA